MSSLYSVELDSRGEPVGFEPIPNDRVTVECGEDGRPERYVIDSVNVVNLNSEPRRDANQQSTADDHVCRTLGEIFEDLDYRIGNGENIRPRLRQLAEATAYEPVPTQLATDYVEDETQYEETP